MTSELKVVMTIICVAASIFFGVIAFAGSQEIQIAEYYEIAQEKKKWDSEPNTKGWDIYRDWLKESTTDNKITRRELREFHDIIEDVDRANMIYNLKK